MISLDNGDKIQGDTTTASKVDYTIQGVVGTTLTQQANGQLPNTIGDLYTSTVNGTVVAGLTLVNTNTTAENVNLYLLPSGGTARRIIPKDLSLGVNYSLIFDGNVIQVLNDKGEALYNIAGLTSSDSPQFTAIELGHASDTTIARESAGTVSVEGVNIVRSVAYVVAASDSEIKTQADYVCDGTDDHVQILAALNALPATGGEVKLLDGTYNCEASVGRNISNITLRGNGKNTILTTTTADLDIISFTGSEGNELTGILIADFCIDGSVGGVTNEDGISWVYVDKSRIENILSKNNDNNGMSLYLCDSNILKSDNCQENSYHGIYLYGCKDNIITINPCGENGHCGIYLTENSCSNIVILNPCLENGDDGLELIESHYNIISNNTINTNGYYGIYANGSNNNIISENEVNENSQSEDNTRDDILLTNSDYNNIQGNTCRAGSLTNKPRYGINIAAATCNENKVINNDLYDDGFGTAPYNNAGTDTVYVDAEDTEAAVAQAHDRQHAITSTDDHTSAATEGQVLKADGNGLPVDATNTDAEVSAGITKLAGIEAGADVTDADNVSGAGALMVADLENPPTEDEATKAPTSEWAFDHDAATTGVHGVGANHVAAIASAGAEAPLKKYTPTLNSLWFHEQWKNLDAWTESYIGSGSHYAQSILKLIEQTGTTINSEARVFTAGTAGIGIYVSGQVFYALVRNWGIVPTNCEHLIGVWEQTVAKPPSLTAKHVGWKIINGRIWATNADGTTETATDTGIDMLDSYTIANLLIECTVTFSELKFYVDGVLKATHTTNIPDQPNVYIYMSIKNTEAANKLWNVQVINAFGS
jgi:parallel beta-helix repeat protein